MAQGDNPKKVFVAATMQDQGKTTVSLGLMAAFQRRRPPVCFMKPVGQRYVELDGARVDEDVALLNAIFPSGAALGDMSPVTVGRSFTRDYIRHPRGEALTRRIADAFARLSAGKGFVVIEGTGHAGVGSCFDTSNADVAALLGAKVILVTSGGIGKPIDEVMLNESLFRDRGCEMLGVVLNKVLPEKLEEIRQVVAAGLGRKGIALLGCIPYEPLLANPTMQHVFEELPCEALCGADRLHNIFDSVVVGAMAAPRAMTSRCPLVIGSNVPGKTAVVRLRLAMPVSLRPHDTAGRRERSSAAVAVAPAQEKAPGLRSRRLRVSPCAAPAQGPTRGCQ